MGNEMGNNNVIGQQVPEESAKDFDKTMANADYSHELSNINGEKDTEKDVTKDVDMSEVLKVPLISSGGDKHMASDQTKLSAANEDLDGKNRGSPQDHASTEDDDGNNYLPTEQNKEKDGAKDLDMSEVLKAPVISNGGDDQMASDQTKISAANEDLDEKNRGSLEDHTSTQDDGNRNLSTEQGDETQEDSGTETATNSAETVAHVGTTTEDITSNKDTSSANEQFTQLEHETTEKNEENTTANPAMLLEESIEGLPEDEEESCSQEVAGASDNLVGGDTVENLEGQTGVSTVVGDNLVGETTSSTESIISGYLADESKEVVVEDEPRERENSSYVKPEGDTNQETFKNEEKQEICEIGKNNTCKTITEDTVVESAEVLEEDKKIQGLENQEEEFPKCNKYGAPDIVEAVSQFQSTLAHPSAASGKEFQKHELSIAEQMLDSVSVAMEHNVIKTAEKEQGGIIERDVADKNEEDNFEGDQKSDGMSEVLKDPIISNGGNDQIASDQTKISAANEDLDEKNRDSLQDHTSIQDDDGNSNLPTEQGDESQEGSGTETTTDGTEKVAAVDTTTEDMTSGNDTSLSDEQFKQVVHEMTETSEESTIPNPLTLLEGIIESAPQDGEEYCSQEAAVVDDNLVGEDTVESLEERQTGVSAVEDLWTPSSVQGATTSSTESIITDHLDDETKEVVLEDEPRERENSSHVRPEDDTNQETSKKEEKQEICEMGNNNSCKTITVDTVIENDEVLEEDEKIQGLENQQEEFPKCSAYGALDIVEAVSQFQSALADPSATNSKELQKHELSIAEQMSDSVSAAMEHNVIETAEKEQGGIVNKDVADKNEEDNFEGDKKSDGIHDSLGLAKVHGEDFTGLGPPLSGPLPILNEEKVHEEVIIEELAAPMTATSHALQPVEDFVKEDIKPDSSDSNEGATTSTCEAKAIDTQETMNSSQCDQPQPLLLEEPEVVKFENSETLSTCMKPVECSSATDLIFPNLFNKERQGTSDKATCFTSESNQEKVTGTVGFAVESEQKKVIANADDSSEEQCLLQKPTLGTDVGEETPLLLSTESINSLSYSSEQHSKVVKDIPMTNITLMQAKDEAVEESEKSPLLSPREQSEGAFRAPNHSARNNKPLCSLMTEDGVGTWSPLKEQEPVQKNSTTVSSPRSKEKQKPKSSLFAICMCCTTATD
ncbi:hypothetical protein CFC21_048264 [Triticum aestivum]|uniref:Uncharacterized protein n=2 Tax=Triticum aestivum TaxID=4565 RepID=A0A3B6GX02_WHEAT|nr:serine-rich adhesin for platelets-like isoform X1 [Triticum aestivum]KAF7038027.1 hypothetical protein CFC21_048264 [Triticum aestivum]